MLDSIFQKTNYRQYLREKLAQSGGRGLITKVAEAAQCQRSHLSRVLSEQLHLTMEQGFRVGRFFNMGRDEEAYFLKLIEYERSGDRDYGAKLKRELNEMRDAQQDLAKRTSEPSLQNTELETLYYSSWFWSAIHIIVSIPKFQKTAQIAMRLNLAPSFVESCLKKLEEFDLVQRAGDSWQISSGGLHLKKEFSDERDSTFELARPSRPRFAIVWRRQRRATACAAGESSSARRMI